MYSVKIFPGANTTAQWFETLFDRGTFPKVDKFLLHTTETEGWPGYDGGAKAPTITYHPRLRQFRQHNFINRSARALVDPDSTPVRENRDNVVQIEIICYTDLIIADQVGGLKVTDLTDDHLADIARLFKWLHDEWGTPLFCNLEFPPYRPYKSVRMSSSVYDAYAGMLGHMHASGNGHTDPGNINAQKILSLAKGSTIIQGDDMPTPADLWAYPLGKNPADGTPTDAAEVMKISSNYAFYTWEIVRKMAEQIGIPVDVDEAAIANMVLAGLKPDIIGAVESAFATVSVAADVTPAEISAIAGAVVAELNSRLAS